MTDVITALIVFAALGAVVCVKARAAGPALLFGTVALVLLTATPLGAELGQAVTAVVDYGQRAAESRR